MEQKINYKFSISSSFGGVLFSNFFFVLSLMMAIICIVSGIGLFSPTGEIIDKLFLLLIMIFPGFGSLIFCFACIIFSAEQLAMIFDDTSRLILTTEGVIDNQNPKSVGKLFKWSEIETLEPIYSRNDNHSWISGIKLILKSFSEVKKKNTYSLNTVGLNSKPEKILDKFKDLKRESNKTLEAKDLEPGEIRIKYFRNPEKSNFVLFTEKDQEPIVSPPKDRNLFLVFNIFAYIFIFYALDIKLPNNSEKHQNYDTRKVKRTYSKEYATFIYCYFNNDGELLVDITITSKPKIKILHIESIESIPPYTIKDEITCIGNCDDKRSWVEIDVGKIKSKSEYIEKLILANGNLKEANINFKQYPDKDTLEKTSFYDSSTPNRGPPPSEHKIYLLSKVKKYSSPDSYEQSKFSSKIIDLKEIPLYEVTNVEYISPNGETFNSPLKNKNRTTNSDSQISPVPKIKIRRK